MLRKAFIAPTLALALMGCVTTGGVPQPAPAPGGLDVARIIASVQSVCSVAVPAQSVIALFNTGLADSLSIVNTLCDAFTRVQARGRSGPGGLLAARVRGVTVYGRRTI
jgi:hypothetical protein